MAGIWVPYPAGFPDPILSQLLPWPVTQTRASYKDLSLTCPYPASRVRTTTGASTG